MEDDDALEMQTNWPCGHATKTKEDTEEEGFLRGGREVRPRILDRPSLNRYGQEFEALIGSIEEVSDC